MIRKTPLVPLIVAAAIWMALPSQLTASPSKTKPTNGTSTIAPASIRQEFRGDANIQLDMKLEQSGRLLQDKFTDTRCTYDVIERVTKTAEDGRPLEKRLFFKELKIRAGDSNVYKHASCESIPIIATLWPQLTFAREDEEELTSDEKMLFGEIYTRSLPDAGAVKSEKPLKDLLRGAVLPVDKDRLLESLQHGLRTLLSANEVTGLRFVDNIFDDSSGKRLVIRTSIKVNHNGSFQGMMPETITDQHGHVDMTIIDEVPLDPKSNLGTHTHSAKINIKGVVPNPNGDPGTATYNIIKMASKTWVANL